MKVYYMLKFFKHEDGRLKTDEKVLEVGKERSRFYSRWREFRGQIRDSLRALGADRYEVLGALEGVPAGQESYMIYSNYPKKGKLTYTDYILKSLYYEEDIEEPKWTMLQKDTVLLGYKCLSAKCEYKGRSWSVYFAPDIPVSLGPWKLRGLPGLILLAIDKEKDFYFYAIGIENGKGEIMKEPKLKNYIKCTAKDIKEAYIQYYDDYEAYQRKIGFPVGSWDAKGKPIIYPKRKAVLIER